MKNQKTTRRATYHLTESDLAKMTTVDPRATYGTKRDDDDSKALGRDETDPKDQVDAENQRT